MRTRSFLGAAVLAASMLLVACSDPAPKQGEIVEKRYDDPDSWYQPGYTIRGTETCSGGYGDTPRVCTRSADIHIPGQWHHDPAHWRLRLKDGDKSGWVEVPESTYNKVSIGQWFDRETGEVIPR